MDRWIVELEPQGRKCLDEWWAGHDFQSPAFFIKSLPVDHWMVVQVAGRYSTELEKLPCVRKLYVDQKIEWRNTAPNDPGYVNQENFDLINMEKAWDISQGGLTSRGDTIVVALIDDGFQLDHEDLITNIWINHDEVPNDGADNDDNGYNDDYYGFNVTTGTDVHPNLEHGTNVAGIVGARGNNSKGIAGINWRVKLMIISGADFESDLIEAYEYVLDMRKRYRLTSGNKGAFVVAANLSAGIDLAFGVDHPLWCEMYDKLGN
ncbi:MAG: S8 family serine peptidase, partial [Saprospiraceae bacterium]